MLLSKRLYKRPRDALGYQSYKVVQRHLESLAALVVAGGSCIDDPRARTTLARAADTAGDEERSAEAWRWPGSWHGTARGNRLLAQNVADVLLAHGKAPATGP